MQAVYPNFCTISLASILFYRERVLSSDTQGARGLLSVNQVSISVVEPKVAELGLAGSASKRATLAALRLPGLHTPSDPWQDHVVLGISSRSEYAAHMSNPYI